MRLSEWNDVLVAHVRSQAQPEGHCFLFVDRDLLSRLSGMTAADALDDFCGAFRAHAGVQPFHPAALEAWRWRQSGFVGPPPMVAGLAMTVLAVTEEPLGGTHGIYRRQNALLGLPGDAVEPQGYGIDVPLLWRCWNAWLDEGGAGLGHSTARELEPWRLQSWARSQGLVRHRDRTLVERFLLERSPRPGAHHTAAAFLEWLEYRGHDGHHLAARLESPAARQIIEVVLSDEQRRLESEEPRVRSSSGRGLLTYDDWDREFGAVVAIDADWVGRTLSQGDRREKVEEGQAYLTLHVDVPPATLLTTGVTERLDGITTVSVGGESAYVTQDEPTLSVRLQARGSLNPGKPTHLLVAEPLLRELRLMLEADGHRTEPVPSAVSGWLWLENLLLHDDANVLRALHWRSPASPRPSVVELVGGLRVAPGVYLVGGEPDVRAPREALVRLDGVALPPKEDGSRAVAAAYPDPGRHVISAAGQEFVLRTAIGQRRVAVGGPLARALDESRLSDPQRDVPAPRIAGAVIDGRPNPEPLVVRCPPGAECLILTTSGEVQQLWPSTPRWLLDFGLDPAAVDVGHALGDQLRDAAILVTRGPAPTRRKRAVMIPARLPRSNTSPRVEPRPDLVAELITDPWTWTGSSDEAQARRLLERALAWRPAVTGRPAGRPAPASVRGAGADLVVDGRVPDNPYDEIIVWLSEQERAQCSVGRFADTWSWLCLRYGRPDISDHWRLLLTQLGALGHVERDYTRQQVSAAPAAVVDLPAARGLSLLTGARPGALLERLDDPDDPDSVVAAATSSWALHWRTPVTAHGSTTPAGPAAIYVEWDRSLREPTRAGLARLGVTLQGCTADTILDGYPRLETLLATNQQLKVSPTTAMHQLRPDAPNVGWHWQACMADTLAGLHRYQLPHGTVYAWREDLAHPLVVVDWSTGQWLARRAAGQTHLLVSRSPGARLYVPGRPSLPPLLARALTLRTGVCARPEHDAAKQDPVFDNVEPHVANKVARCLGQTIDYRFGTEDR